VSFSETFIRRPVGTTLLTIAMALAGGIAYLVLPVSPLPQVEFPTMSVSANLPGASPETMASSVATPLERQFGRIAGLTEMSSSNYLGSTSITLQFDLNRNIDAAARDVQAAINAARTQLPANLPTNPTYRKVNPADAPIMILAVSSDIYSVGQMYDAASSILQQKLSQTKGVGQVTVGGGALPAVRVEVNPTILNNLGLGLDDVRAALGRANANRPKGEVSHAGKVWMLSTTDQLNGAKEYRPLIIAYRNGSPIRISDVAEVDDSVEDIRTGGSANGTPAVLMIVFRQPGANIIETVDRVRGLLPVLQNEIPPAMKLSVVLDRTTTIRASVLDVEKTLLLSIALVILVVFAFLRDVRTTLIPSIAVPISLVGTFAVMYLCNYSIDNLSLMALTIATGFVVDDAIVVIENITRHLEAGVPPFKAALIGTKEIAFTVVSISISLVAVFIPLLLMGGIVGRLFREFAVTLSVAIGVSLIVSLTTTPMMCALLLRPAHEEKHGRLYRASEWVFDTVLARYEVILRWVLRHQRLTLSVTLATVAVNITLMVIVPKGFFPQQDTGRLQASLVADQSNSFQQTKHVLARFMKVISEDPAVQDVIAFSGGSGGTANAGRGFVTLKPLDERGLSADLVIARLRKSLAKIPGGTLFLSATQDLRIGGFQSAAQYQYTLRGDNLAELNDYAPRMVARIRKIDGLLDVNSDQQDRGLQAGLVIDRDTASRLGITAQAADDALYDAFGQRQVSTTYATLNQYHVVMEVDPRLWATPEGLRYLYANSVTGAQVPITAFTHYAPSTTLLAVTHSGQFPAVTISFNLRPGKALGDAVTAIHAAEVEMGLPATIHGSFQGTAQAFQDSLASQPYLLAAALFVVYIVLGILYESLVHPITIISTLFSAGVGAILALRLFGMDLSVIAVIGIILLIGIVKKNAIMMIDFALDQERNHGKRPEEAIFEACLRRFRPITMTTLAALLGGLPLALGHGVGSELRQPLGVAIVGGLVVSQMLTLFTTPVVYLYLDRLRRKGPLVFVVFMLTGFVGLLFLSLAVDPEPEEKKA
jgi:multidrug efflux pump